VTIAIAVQVHDGVVLASDSATTLIDTIKTAPDNVLNPSYSLHGRDSLAGMVQTSGIT
jgi:hypothetical protein